mgnify:CR=1 FL=1
MKARQYINMMGMAAAVLLSSCVKDTLYDTPRPDKGAVTISLTGLSADDNYVLDMEGRWPTLQVRHSPIPTCSIREHTVW